MNVQHRTSNVQHRMKKQTPNTEFCNWPATWLPALVFGNCSTIYMIRPEYQAIFPSFTFQCWWFRKKSKIESFLLTRITCGKNPAGIRSFQALMDSCFRRNDNRGALRTFSSFTIGCWMFDVLSFLVDQTGRFLGRGRADT